MPRIGDNILPSHMKLAKRLRHSDGGSFTDTGLHYGEVQRVIYPQDTNSKTRKYLEYDVLVQYRSKNKSGAGRMYQNCIVANNLFGLADSGYQVLRAENSASKGTDYGLGSKVLVLCLNGETSQPVIIGGMPDPKDESQSHIDKDSGILLDYRFNGISVIVNKDGEFQLTYTGKTKINGDVDDNVQSEQAGHSLSLTKDGNVNVVTKQKMIVKPDKGLEVGKATDKMALFETYRKQENICNNTIQQNMATLQNLLTALSAVIATASVTPVAPGAPVAALAPAAPIIVQAAQAAGNISQAITVFEQQKDSFLSKNNLND